MATKHPPPLAPPEDDSALTELQKFEQALSKRFPDGRLIQRFEMPSQVKHCAAIYLMEITSKEELRASIYADSTMDPIERTSATLATDAQRREAARASCVGLMTRDEPPVYRHLNHDGMPWHQPDNWPSKVWSSIITYFGTINGVSTSELLEGIRGARPIGLGGEPPRKTNETQSHPATERRNVG